MKKADIRKLIIQEINSMGEGEFHHVCVEFLSEKHNQRFINTGINRKNRPIGHDLDAISPDNRIAGEFSVEQKYFSGRFDKLRNDLEHAISRNPKPQEIELISSQPIGNISRKLLSAYFKLVSYRKKIKIELYDSNRLVDELLDMTMKSQSFFNIVSQQITLLRKLMVLYGSENLFPVISQEYKTRREEEEAIILLVANNPITLIHGISGVGKSQLVTKIRKNLNLNFDYVIWVAGEELKDFNSLKRYELKMYGNTYDLIELAKNSNVLICIDSLEGKDTILEQLPNVSLSKGSRIIITSQKNTKVKGIKSFHLEGMKKNEFRVVIQDNNNLSDDVADQVFSFCSGHPLVASILAKMLRSADLQQTDIENSLNALGGLEAGKNQSLLDRLMVNHLNVIKPGIEFIKALNADRIHKVLAEYILKKIEINKLVARGFLLDLDSSYYKVHDLILNTIRESKLQLNTEQWIDQIVHVFESRDKGLSELDFYQISNNHFDIVRKFAWETQDITALYLVASYTEVDSKFNAEEFIEKFTPNVTNLDFQNATYFEVMLAIEFYEVMYRHYQYYARDYVKAQEMLKSGLDVCLKYMAQGSDRTFEKNVLHHSGKFYRLLKKYDEAIDAYVKTISLDDSFLEPRIQIFRFYHWINTDRDSTAELKAKHGGKADPEWIKKILDTANSNYEKVSPSLLLNTFDELRKSPFYGVIDQYVASYEDIFYRTIKIAQFRNRHNYITILAGVGDRFIRYNPAKFEEALDSLSLPSPTSAGPGIAFHLGQIYKSLAKAKKSRTLLLLAGTYYDKSLLSEKISDFDLSHIIDAYNILGEYQKANKLYDRIQRKDGAFIHLRRAWTLYMLHKRSEALEEIEKGINVLPDHLHGLHMKNFTDLKQKIESSEILEDSRTW